MSETDSKRPPLGGLAAVAIVMITLGIFMMVVGAALSAKEVSVGGVILIGPIPIVVGSGPLAELLAILATMLTLVLLVVVLYLARSRRKP